MMAVGVESTLRIRRVASKITKNSRKTSLSWVARKRMKNALVAEAEVTMIVVALGYVIAAGSSDRPEGTRFAPPHLIRFHFIH
jgi:hypothetical protein